MWFIIEQNKRKTAIFLVILTLFFLFFGTALGFSFSGDMYNGNYYGTLIGLLISIVCFIGIIIYTKFNASHFFLSQVGATPIKKEDLPILYNVVEEMSIAASLGFIPKIYIINSEIPNAFSVGVNEKNAAVAVTVGLLSNLNRDELQGVIAHEIAHIKNLDTLYLMYAGVIFGVVVCVSDTILRSISRSSSRSSKGNAGIAVLIALVLAIISPILVRMLYLTISRKREYLADACACQYTRYPTGLASALNKISNFSYSGNKKAVLKNEKIFSGPIVSCMYIHNFLQKEKPSFLDELFSTHPSTKKRIEVLKQMGAADIEEYAKVYSMVVSDKALIKKDNLIKMNIATIPIIIPAAADNSPVISKDAIQTKEETPDETFKTERIIRQREAKDGLKKAMNYTIILCDCGTKLKIPPELKISEITCPNCNKVHKILV